MITNEYIEFDSYTDEELVWIYQERTVQDAVIEILKRYKHIIHYICNSYFLPGAEFEDLIQEAYLGLFKAVIDYCPERGVPFKAFVSLCVKRQIITALKQATRKKHIPLNDAFSLDKPLFDDADTDKVLIDLVPAPSYYQPENSLVMKETLHEVRQQFIMQFSSFEANIMALYIDGYSYSQIANLLKVEEKSITNGMYRIQKKLKRMRHQIAIEKENG